MVDPSILAAVVGIVGSSVIVGIPATIAAIASRRTERSVGRPAGGEADIHARMDTIEVLLLQQIRDLARFVAEPSATNPTGLRAMIHDMREAVTPAVAGAQAAVRMEAVLNTLPEMLEELPARVVAAIDAADTDPPEEAT